MDVAELFEGHRSDAPAADTRGHEDLAWQRLLERLAAERPTVVAYTFPDAGGRRWT